MERPALGSRRRPISFVEDRYGHDRRYAIDAGKIIEQELGWHASKTFETGMAKTVHWYLENRSWWHSIIERGYDLGALDADIRLMGLRAPTPNSAQFRPFILIRQNQHSPRPSNRTSL